MDTKTADVTKLDMPEPPENHYWAVEKGSFHIDHVVLYKTGFLGIPKKVDSRVLQFYYASDPGEPREVMPPAESIQFGAEMIMQEINGSKEWERYYGTYVKETS